MLTYNMDRSSVESSGISGATSTNLAKILDCFYLNVDRFEQSVGRWLSSHGYWESWITSWMTKNIKPGSVCVDVGANYGYYTRIMENLAKEDGKVIAFEANTSLCNLISTSIYDYPNPGAADVKIFNLAVSDSVGTVRLNIPPQYLGGSSIVWGNKLPSDLPDDLWTEFLDIKSDTLDNILSDIDHIDLIKIDIEGAEYLAWKGMQKTLDKTDLIVIEFGNYLPSEFIDEVYSRYNVNYIDLDGSEKALSRTDLDNLTDLVMAVLRKND